MGLSVHGGGKVGGRSAQSGSRLLSLCRCSSSIFSCRKETGTEHPRLRWGSVLTCATEKRPIRKVLQELKREYFAVVVCENARLKSDAGGWEFVLSLKPVASELCVALRDAAFQSVTCNSVISKRLNSIPPFVFKNSMQSLLQTRQIFSSCIMINKVVPTKN